MRGLRHWKAWLLLVAIVAVACGGPQPASTPTPTSTPQPTPTATSAPTPTPTPVPMETYKAELLGLSFSYPIGWTLDASDPTLVTLDPGLGGVVRISIRLAGPTTLDDQLAQQLRELEQLPGFQKLSTLIRNGEGLHYVIRGEWTNGGTAFRGDITLRVVGAVVFSLLAASPKESYESQRHSFEQLSASFKVSPGSATRALDTAAPVEGVLDTIGDGTASIRGLPAPPALTWGFQTRAQFQAVVETQVLSDETRGETERLQRLCSVLDLCEVSANLFPITVELITEGVLGYYQKGDKSLTMVSDQAKLDLLAALTYAHEYAHALQDERFDLTALVPAEDTFDASKALLALKEGDARLSEYLFYETLPLEQQTETAELLRSRTQEFSRSPAVARAPRIIKQTFGWEFGAGAEFVFRLYLEGGFEAVNKAFQRPPQSTEQVLHPEKYLAGEPVRATPPPDLEAALGLGWKTADEGVLGELLTGIHLGAFLPGERAKEAAAGWAGTVTRC